MIKFLQPLSQRLTGPGVWWNNYRSCPLLHVFGVRPKLYTWWGREVFQMWIKDIQLMIEQNCVMHPMRMIVNLCDLVLNDRSLEWWPFIGCWYIFIAGFWSSRLCKASAAEWCLLGVVCKFQSVFGPGSMFVNLTLEVSPQKVVARSQIWQALGLWMSSNTRGFHSKLP